MANDERRLRSESDQLLEALDDMRRAERAKRTEDISTPEFHRLADDVEVKARHVWEVAARENEDGNRTETTDRSIEETPRLGQN
jgi:hypothetical protein